MAVFSLQHDKCFNKKRINNGFEFVSKPESEKVKHHFEVSSPIKYLGIYVNMIYWIVA
jgi:hypothetical protein